jgi:hypothetical protein
MGRADSPLRDRVVFIQGAPRSGTTWLVTMLAAHHQVAGVDAESHLFDYGVGQLFDNLEGRHPRLHGLTRYLDREELADLARDLCDGVFMAMREHLGARPAPPFVVEKTPVGERVDGLDLERKRDCYPDAWYLHIVREREAVVRSLMRAPFMADRSRQACEQLYDGVTGHIRGTLGALPRYREVSYEQLLADPPAGCADIFAWFGADASDAALEPIRILSRERVSEMGAPAAPARRGLGRRALDKARALTAERPAAASDPTAGERIAFALIHGLHHREAEALEALTHPKLEFVYRGPQVDEWHEGDEGRAALVHLGESIFGRRHLNEWWASSGGPGQWWTATSGKPFWSVFFSALGGDGTRVDVALGLTIEDDLIRRLTVVSAGPLTGRPIVAP